MKRKNVVTALLVAGTLATTPAFSQFSTLTPSNIGSPTGDDYVLDVPSNPTYNRLGHLQSGTYGDSWSQWAAIGTPNLINPPSSNDYYGFFSNWTSDRAFFGLRYEGYNRANAMIAFGDNVDGYPDTNRLIFQFDSWIASQSKEIATMLATGAFGLATATPSTLFHIDCTNLISSAPSNVRFENLQRRRVGNYLSIDRNGYVFDTGIPITSGGGSTNNCLNVNYVPKVISSSGITDCSQIYDDGTSVGIGTTGPFGYTVTASNNVQPGPWSSVSSGTLKLKVDGVTMSDGYLITSDARFKTNVKPLTHASDIIQKLNGVSYAWKEGVLDRKFDNTPQLGFIAQEVEKVLPEVVYKDEKGYNSINYTALIPVLVEALKDQQAQIAQLTQRLNAVSGAAVPASNTDRYAFDVFPNPTHGDLYLKALNLKATDVATVRVSDLDGKQLLSVKLECHGDCSDKLVLPATLAASQVVCTLFVNGKAVATQTVTVTR